MLKVEGLCANYGKVRILEDINFEIKAGEWLMLCGPNGAGKSTLAKALAGQIPFEGNAQLENRDIKDFKPAELARRIGYLTQHHAAAYGFSVEEIVAMGRYPYRKGFRTGENQEDVSKTEYALEITGLKKLRSRSITQLSGGELQRVFLAQVFAQDPSIMLLDEPGNHLDMKYQKQLFELMEEWLRGENRAVISVVHDLSLARKYGNKALLLHQGRQTAYGTIGQTLSDENLNTVYDMEVRAWLTSLFEEWK